MVWLVDDRKVCKDDLNFLARQFGASENARCARFVRPQRQRQFVLGRVLLRLALARMLGVSPAAIEIIERPGDAPQLVIPGSEGLRPGYSLSHSSDWIACAISLDTTLGIDIEMIDPARDIMALAQVAFHPSEYQWLQHQPRERQESAFYHLWSLKEALYKMKAGADSLPLLVDATGNLAAQGHGWHSYALEHADLSCVVCSGQPLTSLPVVKQIELTRADWHC